MSLSVAVFTLFQFYFLLLYPHLSTGVICVPHKCVALDVYPLLASSRHFVGTNALFSRETIGTPWAIASELRGFAALQQNGFAALQQNSRDLLQQVTLREVAPVFGTSLPNSHW